MFNNLVESTSKNQENTRKSLYFGITAVCNTAFLTAIIVWSIFSFDFAASAGGDDLTLNTLVAPAALPENKPLPPETKQPEKTAVAKDAPQNVDFIRDPVANINHPTDPPKNASVEKSTGTQVRENVPYIVSDRDKQAANGGLDMPERDGGTTKSAPIQIKPRTNNDDEKEAAPIIEPKTKEAAATPKKLAPVSKGVVNGIAKSLPKPIYPAPAKAIKAGGAVTVQVTIDENGSVISAAATSGHPLLRAAATSAARQAKFTPTRLSDQPVKVTGIIVYNFVPQ